MKLGIFSGGYLDLSSWWSIFATNLNIYERIDLVEDMAIDAKRTMRLINFVMTFPSFIYPELFCFA